MKRTPLKRVSKQRAADNRRYAKFRELYFADNATCEYCGQAPTVEFDHICRGVNRDKSLTNPNTGLGTCSECHRKFGDLPPLAKYAFKVRASLRKLNEYFGVRGDMHPPERFTVADLWEELT